MITYYSEEETLQRVTRLTHLRLTALIDAEAVVPVRQGAALAFRQADIARLELLCDLAELYEMQDEQAALVVWLIDQLHATRSDLHRVLGALTDAPDDLRARIVGVLVQDQASGDRS